jgi:hypothetical protein
MVYQGISMTTHLSSIKAVGIACVAFTILFCLNFAFYRAYGPHTGQPIYIAWMQLSKFLIFVIPGYISAYVVRKYGMLHGAIVGLGECLITVVIYSIRDNRMERSFIDGWYFQIAFCVIAAGIGGLLWDLQAFVLSYAKSKSKR